MSIYRLVVLVLVVVVMWLIANSSSYFLIGFLIGVMLAFAYRDGETRRP